MTPQQEPASLAEVLEAARNGLQWYRDTYPEADSGADDEMMAQIDAALAAAPAQQAGAPLPLAPSEAKEWK